MYSVTRPLYLAFSIVLSLASICGATDLSGEELADPRMGYKSIKAIAREVRTPEKKNEAVRKLTAIVKDESINVYLRAQAAREIGDVGGTEAKDVLKELADSLPWEDGKRDFKWATYSGYWKLRVVEKTDRQSKIDSLLEALSARHDGVNATCVQVWASEELANMGAEEALPDITKSIKFCYGKSTAATNLIHRCELKIELLKSHAERHDALVKGLEMVDVDMKRWAIRELAKLQTKEARATLVAYAASLEHQWYVQEGAKMRSTSPKSGPSVVEKTLTAGMYHWILDALLDFGMTYAEIGEAGLHPGQCFAISP